MVYSVLLLPGSSYTTARKCIFRAGLFALRIVLLISVNIK